MSEWQPIETAPKDGTPVLGFMPNKYQRRGGYNVILWHGSHWKSTSAWVEHPTHWMPIPAPPQREKQT